MRGHARIGLLVPYTNTNLEPDMALMAPDGVVLHVARMGGYDADEIPDETQMQGFGGADLEEPLRLLAGAQPDVILYGCTSATLSHGPAFDSALASRIAESSGAQAVTAAGALIEALTALDVSRVGFASPYVPALNELAAGFLQKMGFEIVARSQVPEPLGNEAQGAMGPADVLALGMGADHDRAEAVVLSCNDMRGVEIAGQLEAVLGKPVVTSNQALLFVALRRLGVVTPIHGFGTLLEGAFR